MLKHRFVICYLLFVICCHGAFGADKTVAQTTLYSNECKDAYYGCMDSFCGVGNSHTIAELSNQTIDGKSCACSDNNVALVEQVGAIRNQLASANTLKTVEVERINAGARADIIFNGERRYDEKGNVITDEKSPETIKAERRASLLALFDTPVEFDNESVSDDIANLNGGALYMATDEMCRKMMPESCEGEVIFLKQLYSRQIVNDCNAFENSVKVAQATADGETAAAEFAVRGALTDSFNAANKFDRGTCMVNFRGCMRESDACGANWENCVSTVASENMQNNAAISTAKTKIATIVKYDIAASTLEMLDAKRNICENILDQCVAVRDYVWDDFLREAAPTLKVAELNAESKMRGSCLTNISDCIQTACKDDIAGKGVATMDACLSRPDMARSFCKVQVDTCERMEPLIWGYVVDKLAAMRVDACTSEVRDCFTSDDRCGSDFSKCIGMDYDYIHDICPLDKLVVCKANNPKFAMSDIDNMLMGLYLNIDNSALDTCQNLVESKMTEICGSTTDCNKFAADNTMGTGSLQPQKDGTIYRVTGMISFGSINVGNASDADDAGRIDISGYMENIMEKNSSVANLDGIASSIQAELKNIQGNINRTIEMIENDPEIQFCTNGRNLEQITGTNATTIARFPNLLNTVKMQIAMSALRQAQDNYNEKFNKAVADATKDASADLAQFMCQRMAQNGGDVMGTASGVDTPLAPPFAISYDVGAGLTMADLTTGGRGMADIGGASGKLARTFKFEFSGGTREVSAIFTRETRNCHLCTTTITQNCKAQKKNGFFGIGGSKTVNCTPNTPIEKCEDIPM